MYTLAWRENQTQVPHLMDRHYQERIRKRMPCSGVSRVDISGFQKLANLSGWWRSVPVRVPPPQIKKNLGRGGGPGNQKNFGYATALHYIWALLGPEIWAQCRMSFILCHVLSVVPWCDKQIGWHAPWRGLRGFSPSDYVRSFKRCIDHAYICNTLHGCQVMQHACKAVHLFVNAAGPSADWAEWRHPSSWSGCLLMWQNMRPGMATHAPLM